MKEKRPGTRLKPAGLTAPEDVSLPMALHCMTLKAMRKTLLLAIRTLWGVALRLHLKPLEDRSRLASETGEVLKDMGEWLISESESLKVSHLLKKES